LKPRSWRELGAISGQLGNGLTLVRADQKRRGMTVGIRIDIGTPILFIADCGCLVALELKLDDLTGIWGRWNYLGRWLEKYEDCDLTKRPAHRTYSVCGGRKRGEHRAAAAGIASGLFES